MYGIHEQSERDILPVNVASHHHQSINTIPRNFLMRQFSQLIEKSQ